MRQISGAAFGPIICTFNVFHHTSRFFDRILITSYLSRHSLVGSSKKPHNVGHIYFVQLILCLSRSLQMQSFSKVITCCGSGIPPIIFSWLGQSIFVSQIFRDSETMWRKMAVVCIGFEKHIVMILR